MSSKRTPAIALFLSFVLPFLLVGGLWGYLTWGHAIDDAGRDGRTIEAFDSEATLPALKAFVFNGLPWGAGGLAICFVVMKFTRRKKID